METVKGTFAGAGIFGLLAHLQTRKTAADDSQLEHTKAEIELRQRICSHINPLNHGLIAAPGNLQWAPYGDGALVARWRIDDQGLGPVLLLAPGWGEDEDVHGIPNPWTAEYEGTTIAITIPLSALTPHIRHLPLADLRDDKPTVGLAQAELIRRIKRVLAGMPEFGGDFRWWYDDAQKIVWVSSDPGPPLREFRTSFAASELEPGLGHQALNPVRPWERAGSDTEPPATPKGVCTGMGGASCIPWEREGACPHVSESLWLGRPPEKEKGEVVFREQVGVDERGRPLPQPDSGDPRVREHADCYCRTDSGEYLCEGDGVCKEIDPGKRQHGLPPALGLVYIEGRDAAMDGKPATGNPYEPTAHVPQGDPVRRANWLQGHADGLDAGLINKGPRKRERASELTVTLLDEWDLPKTSGGKVELSPDAVDQIDHEIRIRIHLYLLRTSAHLVEPESIQWERRWDRVEISIPRAPKFHMALTELDPTGRTQPAEPPTVALGQMYEAFEFGQRIIALVNAGREITGRPAAPLAGPVDWSFDGGGLIVKTEDDKITFPICWLDRPLYDAMNELTDVHQEMEKARVDREKEKAEKLEISAREDVCRDLTEALSLLRRADKQALHLNNMRIFTPEAVDAVLEALDWHAGVLKTCKKD